MCTTYLHLCVVSLVADDLPLLCVLTLLCRGPWLRPQHCTDPERLALRDALRIPDRLGLGGAAVGPTPDPLGHTIYTAFTSG